MKNKILLLATLFCFLMVSQAEAQLSKKEKKEWKKKLKGTDPEDFKNMMEENSALKGQVNSMNSQVSNLQSTLSEKNARIAQLQDKVNSLETQVEDLTTKDISEDNSTRVAKGVVFKVQIGAYKNKDLSTYTANSEDMATESGADGTQKYTLGNFTDYWEADKFKKELRNMGVKDAWIVPYKDGQRVPMKDVLEGVI